MIQKKIAKNMMMQTWKTIVARLIMYKPYILQRLNEATEKIAAQIGKEEHFNDLYDLRKYHFKQ
jgi:hypothetical protein